MVIACKIKDPEWPWVAISCQNPFSTSKAVARFLGFLVYIKIDDLIYCLKRVFIDYAG